MPFPDVDPWETLQKTYSRTRAVLDRFSSELHALYAMDGSSKRIAALDGAQVAGSEGLHSWTEEPSGVSCVRSFWWGLFLFMDYGMWGFVLCSRRNLKPMCSYTS